MRRRRFLEVLCKAALLAAAPAVRLAERVLPERVLEAVRARRAPGPVARLDPGRVGRPGRWAG